MTPTQVAPEQLFVLTAVKSWDLWTSRTAKFFDNLTDQQMLAEVAPGKNRAVYLYGHLIAVHDAMIPQLGLGDATYPALREQYLSQPDSPAVQPQIGELRQAWKAVHERLNSLFAELTPDQWLAAHATVPADEFATQPHRNRLSILLSRTSHAGYHLGQLMLMPR